MPELKGNSSSAYHAEDHHDTRSPLLNSYATMSYPPK